MKVILKAELTPAEFHDLMIGILSPGSQVTRAVSEDEVSDWATATRLQNKARKEADKKEKP